MCLLSIAIAVIRTRRGMQPTHCHSRTHTHSQTFRCEHRKSWASTK